ncbi:MAG: hypothetical protein R3B68_11085 [Phycisphaerales bacterium]
MRETDPLVAAFLAERHVACPTCGYDLHGVGGARCPECGEGLWLRLSASSESPSRAAAAMRRIGVPLLIAGGAFLAYRVAMSITYGFGIYGWLQSSFDLAQTAALVVCGWFAFRAPIRPPAHEQRIASTLALFRIGAWVYAVYWLVFTSWAIWPWF